MEKERKITAPDGCEIEKVELIDGVAVVTFKEKERQLPKSWEEFCEMYPLLDNEVSIDPEDCTVYDRYSPSSDRTHRDCQSDILTLQNRATAEAVLALCQLIQLRDAYNGDWVPDWTEDATEKYFITMDSETISRESYYTCPVSPLYFKTEDLRDEFLRNFSPLIEKLKPLYGIREEIYIKVEEKGGDE